MKTQTPTPQPAPKTPKRKRTHIPPLAPAQLDLALEMLNSAKLPARAARQLADILRAAADPEAEDPKAVLRALPAARRRNAARTAMVSRKAAQRALKRGGARLLEMPDDEWDALMNETQDAE